MLRLNKGILMVGIPLLLSIMAIIKHSITLFIIYILVHFLVLKIIPAFKHCENIGMFVIVVFSSIPINVYIFNVLVDMGLFFDSFPIINVLRGVLYYIILLSIEEVIMGILTRWVWKKQYKFVD